jgi:hypothetical protein
VYEKAVENKQKLKQKFHESLRTATEFLLQLTVSQTAVLTAASNRCKYQNSPHAFEE